MVEERRRKTKHGRHSKKRKNDRVMVRRAEVGIGNMRDNSENKDKKLTRRLRKPKGDQYKGIGKDNPR